MGEPEEKNSVVTAAIVATKKIRNPDKYYVYVMRLTRKNKSVSVIYRRYSEFFQMHCDMIEAYRELISSKPRLLPPLPKGSAISRTTAKVAEERMSSLREYLEALMKLDVKYISCEIMEEFFTVNDDDLLFMKSADDDADTKNAAEEIGGPVALEEFEAIEDFNPKDKKSVKLIAGEIVEVVEKSESGWWYISWSGGIGWVPANYLRPLDGGVPDMIACQAGSFYQCVSNFKASSRDEVSFSKGEITTVELMSHDGWWYITVGGKKGLGPAQFLKKVEGDLLLEDLIENPPALDPEQTSKANASSLVPRSNQHKRTSTRRVRKSMRSKRPAPNAANIPAAIPEGDEMVVLEEYQASGVGQMSLSVGDRVIVTNQEKDEWWYVWKDTKQGWFPAAFLMDENEIKKPESFKVISDYKAASAQELAAKKGQFYTKHLPSDVRICQYGRICQYVRICQYGKICQYARICQYGKICQYGSGRFP
ncbi:SH3 and PX domain-containing protein 2B-like [Bolinopsis microptera]|uniref:SH3 and PX domain-containing protein 2B-like n=1 Tax=Bolinopsis microptera TaxID=2820187 RepID=UPI00307958AC